MKFLTKNTLTLLLLLFSKICFAQSGGQNITVIPPSPASSALEKYSDYPVSIYTGVPDISIPIYEIKSGDMKLPISISYHASGIKIGDDSYPVGLGWSINAGGRISRTVRSKPDESLIAFPPTPLPNYYSMSNVGDRKQIQSDINNLDMEPDLFSFNLGLSAKPSGRFLFDGQSKNLAHGLLSEPMFLPKSNIKFSYVPNQNMGNYTYGINTINLIDEEGISYNFGEGNNRKEFTTSGSSDIISSWLLTSILPASKNEQDKILFDYSAGSTVYKENYFGSVTVLDSCDEHLAFIETQKDPSNRPLYVPAVPDYFVYVNNPEISDWMFNNSHVNHYKIRNIETISFNGGQAKFVFNPVSNMLNSITIVDSQNAIIKKANFYYSNYQSYTKEIKLDSIVMSGSDNQKQTYRFQYNESVQVSHNPLAQDFWGYFNGSYNSSLLPVWENVPSYSTDNPVLTAGGGSPSAQVPITIGNAYRDADEIAMKRFSLEKITYPTGGTTEFELEANRYLNPATNELKIVGGLRIKKIISKSDPNALPIIKSFTYGINGNGAGVAVNVPGYDDFVTENVILYGDLVIPGIGWARQRTFSSSPNTDLSYIDGSAVYYTHVSESTINTAADTLGKTSYTYEIPLQKLYDNYLDPNGAIFQTKLVKLLNGYNFPNLLERKSFKKKGAAYVPVNSNQYVYSWNSNTYDAQPNGFPREIIVHPMYQYVLRKGPSSGPYGDDHYLDQMPVFTMDETSKITNLTFKIQEETSTTYSLNQTNGLDSAQTVTSYEYGSNKHAFPTSTTISASSGDVYKSNLIYPLDYANLSGMDDLTLGVKNLQQLNAVSQPVEKYTELWQNNVNKGVVNAVFNTFEANKPFLNKVYLTEFIAPSTAFIPSNVINGAIVKSSLYKEKLNMVYNPMGKILEQNVVSGSKTSYIWAYNGMYPILEVKNADYLNTQMIVGNATINTVYNSNPNKSTIDALVATLRGAIPNAQITSYTYDPLVGMTSATDSKGMTIYYEYDSFQRLKTIKDQNGNILKQTDYHYKN